MGQATAPVEAIGRSAPRVDFDALMRAHRRELLVHCYRLLGSWTDAEDCVQEVSLRAWRGLARFEGRSSARAWLYRIATNACLSARRRRARRSLPEVEVAPTPAGSPPAPPIEEARWVEPMPAFDASAERTVVKERGGALPLRAFDPEAVASAREEVSLAFLVALQRLAPRQRAALVLRDVVGYETNEVADILGTTTAAVHSALARARTRLHASRNDARIERPGRGEQGILRQYVAAWEAGDVKALVALFSHDAVVSMPPFATWYRGRAAIAGWLAGVLDGERAFRFFPARANGPHAFALYKSGGPCLPGEAGHDGFEPHCIQLVWVERGRVSRVVSFLNARLVRSFGFGPRPPRQK